MREAEQSGVEAYSPCCLHCFHIAISYSELVLFSQHCPSRSSCNPCTIPPCVSNSAVVSQQGVDRVERAEGSSWWWRRVAGTQLNIYVCTCELGVLNPQATGGAGGGLGG